MLSFRFYDYSMLHVMLHDSLISSQLFSDFSPDLVLFLRLSTFVYHFVNNYWSIIPTTKA